MNKYKLNQRKCYRIKNLKLHLQCISISSYIVQFEALFLSKIKFFYLELREEVHMRLD